VDWTEATEKVAADLIPLRTEIQEIAACFYRGAMTDRKGQSVFAQPARQLAIADHRLNYGSLLLLIDRRFVKCRKIDSDATGAHGQAAPV
jgi:hypothetical protein